MKSQKKDKLSTYTARFRLRNTLDALDIFRKPLPTFNMRGRYTVPSICGAMVTFVIVNIALLYSTIKFVQLMSRANPLVSSFLKKGVFDVDNVLNLRDKGQRFAFGVEGFLDKELKEDPRYVKGFARMFGYVNNERYEKMIPYHKCTAEDFDEFAPPAPEAEGLLEDYKNNPNRNLYCMDWDKYSETLAIWGVTFDEVSYQRFEYVLVPCNYVHAEIGPTDDYVADECIADRDEQIKYLGNLRLIVYTTQQEFDQGAYGDEAIVTRSRFWTR